MGVKTLVLNHIQRMELDVSLNELELVRQDIYIFTGREALDIHDLDTIADIPFINYEAELQRQNARDDRTI